MADRLAEVEAQIAALTAERAALQAAATTERCAAGQHDLVFVGGWVWRTVRPVPPLGLGVGSCNSLPAGTLTRGSRAWRPQKCAHCEYTRSNEPPARSYTEMMDEIGAEWDSLIDSHRRLP